MARHYAKVRNDRARRAIDALERRAALHPVPAINDETIIIGAVNLAAIGCKF